MKALKRIFPVKPKDFMYTTRKIRTVMFFFNLCTNVDFVYEKFSIDISKEPF